MNIEKDPNVSVYTPEFLDTFCFIPARMRRPPYYECLYIAVRL
jgi:hypothetical protein